ncbi:MAG TPA: hypothetical protein VMG12_07780 [Polyangiaceae bacterium]|nr:hypothetical protein [Polyangiaceae bacterium]
MSELVFDHVWSDPLKDVSLRASAGLHVILGDESDGAGALVELCAGVRTPRRGRLTLDGQAPSTSPLCRRRIASLLPVEEPTPLTKGDVRAWLAELTPLRGLERDAVLERCSVAPDRSMRSLSSAERRELACWVALAQPDAALWVLHDPLAACGAGQREHVLARIAELARASIVLVTTTSIAEVRALGGRCQRLDRGLLEPLAEGEAQRAAWLGSPGACLTLEAAAPRELLPALAEQPDIHELRYDEDGGGRILVRGADAERLALAVARAIASSGVEVRSLRTGADDLDALRAAATAMNDAAGAAYRAARARRPATSATPELEPPPPAPEGSA